MRLQRRVMGFCKLSSSCSIEMVIVVIKEISVDISGFNFLVGTIDDRQAVVYFTVYKTSNHSKVSIFYTSFSDKVLPVYFFCDCFSSVALLDKPSCDGSVIPVRALKRF